MKKDKVEITDSATPKKEEVKSEKGDKTARTAKDGSKRSFGNLSSAMIDYKNVDLLKKFLNPHSRIVSKKRTGISAKHQRLIANAVKRARFLGLLPYVAR